jgi:hypothetical protein
MAKHYGIPTIETADLTVVNSPIIGLETENVYYSTEESVVLSEIEQTAVDAGVKRDMVTSYTFPVGGVDTLQLRAKTAIKEAGEPISVVLDITTSAGADTATALVRAPQYADDGSGLFPIGAAWDFVVDSDPTKKIVSVTGLDSVVGGKAGNIFEVMVLPTEGSWVAAAAVRGKEPTLSVPNTINIAVGKDSSRYVKSGRTEVPNLSLTQANIAYGVSLTKLNGHRVSVRIDIKDDQRILKERQIFTGYRPNGSPSLGDGEDESEVTVEGQYEKFLIFNAETAL